MENIVKSLDLLSKLEVGDTISRVDGHLIIHKHDSFSTKLIRQFWSGDDRKSTMFYVSSILSNAVYKNIFIEQRVYKGISNLRKTYESDLNFIEELDDMVNRIRRRTIK